MAIEFAKMYPNKFYRGKVVDRKLPWLFTDWKCSRGELYFIKDRTRLGYVVIEPHIKPKASPNRDWGWKRWQAVVDALPEIDWVQINPKHQRLLQGVRRIAAPSFVDACCRLAQARAYVGPEGGLYHAAAALHVPSVAIFGGFVSPANQGYDDAINLFESMNGESPCGQRVYCEHCQEAMRRIKPERVIESIRSILS